MRGSFVLAPEGFIRGVNDSIALGFGLDFGRYNAGYGFGGYRDQCLHFEPGPAGTSVCTEVSSNGGTYNYVFAPVVMQWNFWLTQRFSAFGEPGVNLYLLGGHGFGDQPGALRRRPFPHRRPDHVDRPARLPDVRVRRLVHDVTLSPGGCCGWPGRSCPDPTSPWRP